MKAENMKHQNKKDLKHNLLYLKCKRGCLLQIFILKIEKFY